MMDRKAFRVSGVILLALIAIALWRLSQFPDWRHLPYDGLFLFSGPAALLFMMVMSFVAKFEPEETHPSWRRWGGKWIVMWSVFFALVEAFTLARSLGLVSLPPMNRPVLGVALVGI